MRRASYEKYAEIRDSLGMTDYKVAKISGVGTATTSNWKTGKYTPKQENLQKIATALGVPVERLLDGDDENEKIAYYTSDETAKVAQEIFENKELRALFDVQRDMSADDLRALHNMALALKRKERGNDE